MEAKMNALLSDLVFFYHKLQSYEIGRAHV